MANLRVEHVRLAGVASCVPETVKGFESLATQFGEEESRKIQQSIGVESRRVAGPATCASDLCHAAAEQILQELPWSRDSITGLIFVSQSPDYFAPATACVLHERLGLSPGCVAFDMNLGCSGYVYGLSIAAQLAQGSGGRVLLLVGDTITKMLDPNDRSTTPLFGDAGSATALEADPSAPPMSFSLGTDGRGKDSLIVRSGAFRSADRLGDSVPQEDRYLTMDGAEVFRFALSEIPKLYRATIASAGWEADDVGAVVMHQSNRFMLEHLRKRLKLSPERFVIALKDYGNASCTSIPLAMSDTWGGVSGSLSKKLTLVGFGVGWSWGGVCLEVDNACMPAITVLPESSCQAPRAVA